MTSPAKFEAPTILMLALCYLGWVICLWGLSGWAAIVGVGLATALHSSLQHEIIHGHPFRRTWINQALVFPTLGLMIPFLRFRDTHLAHHQDARLTDPYDDPESNYLDPVVWSRLRPGLRTILRANNTLLGRLLLGPAIAQVAFMRADWVAFQRGDRAVARGWVWHVPSVGLVLGLVGLSPLDFWSYAAGAYLGLSLLKIRTFAEHRAHDHVAARTVIIEDRGPLAWLFLNNNLHVVHHMHPRVPWYRLPALYRADKDRFLGRNGGYLFRSYGVLFARYFLRAKDPVPHPHWPDS